MVGIRMYQHIGLTTEAYVFLTENTKRVPSSVCPKCSHAISTRMDFKIYMEEDVFYGDGPSLHEYSLKDGRVVREVIQAMPMSSGPMGFLCLEIDGERLFEWTDDEIRNAE